MHSDIAIYQHVALKLSAKTIFPYTCALFGFPIEWNVGSEACSGSFVAAFTHAASGEAAAAPHKA
eukprot:6464246-Amphidinium_carterae.1